MLAARHDDDDDDDDDDSSFACTQLSSFKYDK